MSVTQQWLTDFPQKGPVMWKAFPSHHVTIASGDGLSFIVKPLQLIWRSGTCRFQARVSFLPISAGAWSYRMLYTRIVAPAWPPGDMSLYVLLLYMHMRTGAWINNESENILRGKIAYPCSKMPAWCTEVFVCWFVMPEKYPRYYIARAYKVSSDPMSISRYH